MPKPTLNQLVNRSTKAVCGITEREVNVRNENIGHAMNALDKGGFHIIGKSVGSGPSKKIWFIRRGGF